MLNKVIFYQPENYPENPVIFLEKMQIPSGQYMYCQKIENKINEYIDSIGLDITLFILEIEKKQKELYRESDEFAWLLHNTFNITQMRDNILLEKSKEIILNNYELFEPLYRQQLENIYHFLKTNYRIDEYFKKKNDYQALKNKYNITNKNTVKKI